LLRWYVEELRLVDWGLDGDAQEFALRQVQEVMRLDPRIGAAELQLLMSLHELSCISVGAAQTSQEIWDHALELFMSVFRLANP